MLEFYNALDSTDGYSVDNFAMKQISLGNIMIDSLVPVMGLDIIVNDNKNHNSQGAFLDNFMYILAKEVAKSRENYVNEYQDSIREICSIYFGSISSDPDKMEAFDKALNEEIVKNLPLFIYKVFLYGTGSSIPVIEKCIVEAANRVGITSYDTFQINSMAGALAKMLASIIIPHPNETVTLICNIEGIGEAHYPELCLSWLQSMDENYTTDHFFTENNGDYRIIHINCPVNVEIFDSMNGLVAAIYDDTPADIMNSSIIANINQDGEKEFVLPANESYTLKITATDNGSVSYSIQEYSFEAGEPVMIQNYYDIPIKTGDVLTGDVKQYEARYITGTTVNGTDTEYVLRNQNSEVIQPNSTLSGNDAKSAYYMVSVHADDAAHGVVVGSGVRQLGSYAQVEAEPLEGYVFSEWYDEDGNIVSTDAIYRMRVENDWNLTAKFNESDQGDTDNKDTDNNDNTQTPDIKDDSSDVGNNDAWGEIIADNGNTNQTVSAPVDKNISSTPVSTRHPETGDNVEQASSWLLLLFGMTVLSNALSLKRRGCL